MILLTRPFNWYHAMTFTLTFDLPQVQICSRAGDHNFPNFPVFILIFIKGQDQTWSLKFADCFNTISIIFDLQCNSPYSVPIR